MTRLAVILIRLYQYLASPWIGNQCRFYPSCSHYAEEAIVRHGFIKGTLLTLRRLGKCHPWHPGGVDLVPDSAAPAERASDPTEHHLTHPLTKK